MMMFLAMDFGGTFVKHCLMDAEGNISERGQFPAPLSSREEFVNAVSTLYDRYRGQVQGLAISMPGVLDSASGYAYAAGAYSGILSKTNIYELLKDAVDVPVSIENDAKAAILAEAWLGALKGCSGGAAVIIGSGLGGGIIMDGKIRRGSHFASGEISGLLMESGNFSFDSIAGSRAGMTGFLVRVAQAKGMNPADFEISAFIQSPVREDPTKPRITGKEVFEWIEAGDEEALAAYRSWIDDLIMVIMNLKAVLDPEKIVIGGGVSRNPRLIKDLQEEFKKRMEPMKMFGMPDCDLEACRYTADANLAGAVYNWMQMYGRE